MSVLVVISTCELRSNLVRAGAGKTQKMAQLYTHKACGILSASDRALLWVFGGGCARLLLVMLKLPRVLERCSSWMALCSYQDKSKMHICDVENTRKGFLGLFGCPKNTDTSMGSGLCSSGNAENITYDSLYEMRK